MAGRTAGGGCAGRRASSRRLLAGGSGGAGEGGVNPLQVLLAQDPTAPTQVGELATVALGRRSLPGGFCLFNQGPALSLAAATVHVPRCGGAQALA